MCHVPYDFPADIYCLGRVFSDMLSETACLEWWLEKPIGDKERFLKRWPDGSDPHSSREIILIWGGMVKLSMDNYL